MTRKFDRDHLTAAAGLVLHQAAFYDFGVWLMTLGRERDLRESMVALALLQRGESVLDVGW